ncbi:hypothetical protein ACFODO_07760 [Acinetobacter sichuanensis]|uniref:Uncharacterized protein n=1 Tax=Acinetobacter sichuanensis TaxID=2136183 RepID=A0A371YK16_9GAMM|nr:hypothetical protein [Acinetobacter sichuanensis]RFC81801.1 hypothetical protein C9E89_019850 [Acinetobacter sichuanensis]
MDESLIIIDRFNIKLLEVVLKDQVTNNEIKNLLNQYIQLGLSRKEDYDSFINVLKKIDYDINPIFEERFEYICDVLTSIDGDVAIDRIIKFKGDPDDIEELAKLVREKNGWILHKVLILKK